jgi:hypothetical protein
MSQSFSNRTSKPVKLAATHRAKLDQRRAANAALRACKVARAKALARNPDYPSDEVVNSVARLFARHWNS